jgi:uncharacterized membrane protein
MKAFLQGSWLGHPLHSLLVHIPTALWPAAFVFDLLANMGLGGAAMVRTSLYAIGFGLLVALLAVPAGVADWMDIKPEKPAYKLGLYHMLLNLVVWALWAINFGVRLGMPATAATVPAGLVILAAAANAIMLVSGYLGGRMVYSYGISVARISKDKWRRKAEAGGSNVPAEEKG